MTVKSDVLKIVWACPQCGAKANKHGKGPCSYRGESCTGFLCECDEDGDKPEHGLSFTDVCGNAMCGHCGWDGVFPSKPKGLAVWERNALDAGWTPPAARKKELGL